MSQITADKIRSWIKTHDTDHELFAEFRGHAYSLVPPLNDDVGILYAPKAQLISGLLYDLDERCPTGMLGRQGLPDPADIAWFEKLCGDGPIYFLGDMDPTDLLLFAWLSASLFKKVHYLGMNDECLRFAGLTTNEIVTIPCSRFELLALEMLKGQLPNLPDLLGPHCHALLERGEKIEAESIFLPRSTPQGNQLLKRLSESIS